MDFSAIIEAVGKFFNSGVGFALVWAGIDKIERNTRPMKNAKGVAFV